MKKWISLVVATAILTAVLAGCGSTASAAPESTTSSASQQAVSSAVSGAASASAASSGPQAIDVAFAVTEADGTVTNYILDAVSGESLADALLANALISDAEAEAGFVTEVNGVKADYDADKAWWMLVDADGNMTDVGVRDITLSDGDSYGFVYTVG